MSPSEIREALARFERNLPDVESQTNAEGVNGSAYAKDAWLLVVAARAYADLLERGRWMHAHDNLTGEDRHWFQTDSVTCESPDAPH